jgi:hypothetical protein
MQAKTLSLALLVMALLIIIIVAAGFGPSFGFKLPTISMH